VNVIGMDGNGVIKSRTTEIADIDPLQLPLSRSVEFRESNLQVASLVNAPDDFVGVLSDNNGKVRGLWASFASDNGRDLVQENRGLSSDLVAETLDIVRDNRVLHSLEAEFGEQPLASARRLGLSDAWVKRIAQANPTAREVLSVSRLVAGSDASRVLQPGDILLAIDDKPVTQFREVERAVASKEQVKATVWRVGWREESAGEDGHPVRQRYRPRGAVGWSDLAGAPSRDQRSARHPARRGLCRVLPVWFAGVALRSDAGQTDR
jgi:hypothetical protein